MINLRNRMEIIISLRNLMIHIRRYVEQENDHLLPDSFRLYYGLEMTMCGNHNKLPCFLLHLGDFLSQLPEG